MNYYVIKGGRVTGSGSNKQYEEGAICIHFSEANDEQLILINEYENGSQRSIDIQELKELSQKGTENLAKYRATEITPDELDPRKQVKLDLLDKKGTEITAEYLELEANAIDKYGVEILEELI